MGQRYCITRRCQACQDSATSNWLLTTAPDVYLYGRIDPFSALPGRRQQNSDIRSDVWGGGQSINASERDK